MASSTVQTPSLAFDCSDSGDGRVIAQYLVTKVVWWATYPQILIVTTSTLSTYNPETFQCTDHWEIADIEAVEFSQTKKQLILRLEKSRFRSAKLKFVCSAQGHLMSLLARLHLKTQGKEPTYQLIGAHRLHYRCIERFADASKKVLFLQISITSIIFLNERGRRVQILPFVYLRKVSFSTHIKGGMVLSTAFHDRFFLCGERHECMNEILTAANEAGVQLHKTSSDITALQLRLRNTQLLNRPSVIRFDVKKVKNTEGAGDAPTASDVVKKSYKEIQLILQGEAMVEMHPSMRIVIARPYKALLAIVRPDWDPRRLVLEFKHEDTLILDLDARDQLVTLLLLVCREAGHHNAILQSSGLNYCRFYHPHPADTATNYDNTIADASMVTFLLRKITQTSIQPDNNGGRRSRGSKVGSPQRRRGKVTPRDCKKKYDLKKSDSRARGCWFQRRIHKEKCTTDPLHETCNSMDSGLLVNENVSIVIAMEELNANLPLDGLTHSEPGQFEAVNKAMELVFEHLTTLVASLRRYQDTNSSELITTLQSLMHLYRHPAAGFTNDKVHSSSTFSFRASVALTTNYLLRQIPHVFDAIHELILQQDFLTRYWCLRLLQSFLDVQFSSTIPDFNDQRVKMVQHFVVHITLQHAIVDLIPTSFAASSGLTFIINSPPIEAAFWTADRNVGNSTPSSLSSDQSSVLYSKEAQVQKEINVVLYETLLTLHDLLVHMRRTAKLQRVARKWRNYSAANRQKRQNCDDDDAAAEKPMDVLAGKLLEKYRFLTESIMDVRLVRTAKTSVSIVSFVLNRFAVKLFANPLQLSPENNQMASSSTGDFYDSQRKGLGALRSFLAEYNTVTEGRQENRSLLFVTEGNIEMPVNVLSYGTSDNVNAAMKKLLNPVTTNGVGTVASNGSMRLEYLNPSEPSNSLRKEDSDAKPLDPRSRIKTFQLEPSTKTSEQPVQERSYDSLGRGNNVPTAVREPVRSRRTANKCDACIGCNDVCINKRCFFCAGKEYQLKATFRGSSETAESTKRQPTWQHLAPLSTDSSSIVEREYSSCEIKRHQSMRSCWIREGDTIYDVTDLLGVHPGGAAVLLEAAQNGGDCGPILKTHPPAAQKMLAQYRLGRYYECNMS
ncbi:hypothetical protein PsorP6_003695 [Peronosclerospora sorghi]|uniref:Uncharacterized protein n=1 Tax=Peronosclerospora sorghi TaxID=230839 RepID=A0ACC0VQ55_9STRA|nr:hypothetical protein PsorP6_003695 [Peronosclerospora sorghi]